MTRIERDVSPVPAEELELLTELLAALRLAEDGPYPGAVLRRSHGARVWTLTDGQVTVDVRGDAPVAGCHGPVWMTMRALLTALWNHDGERRCWFGIDDERDTYGRATAIVRGPHTEARIDLPDRPPIPVAGTPGRNSVLATAQVDLEALVRALRTASLTPVGVRVSGAPKGVLQIDTDVVIVEGADRRGLDRPMEVRVGARTAMRVGPAVTLEADVDLVPLFLLGGSFPPATATLTFTDLGEVWLRAGACTLVLPAEVHQYEPDDLDAVVFLVGRVEGTGEAVLSTASDLPVDDTIVWLESQPDEYGRLERIEELHPIVWLAEPEPYGVSRTTP